VGLAARDADQLGSAATSLGECRHWPCDVTNDQQVVELFARVVADWQGLDVLVNAVGKSDRRLGMSCSPADFQAAWETNFLSLVRCTRAALPLLEPARGSIVNVASLAARLAVANMGPYPVTKFAVAAYCQQLRYELRQQRSGVHVLLVCPGPVRRADAGTRYAANENLPPRAMLPGAGVRLPGIDPDRLAGMIVRACERRRPELVVPGRIRWLLALASLWPGLADQIVAWKMRG
jgi:NAD(P)-dependent dehydrogenase (short-subunit alcohol dehydrogenase family)